MRAPQRHEVGPVGKKAPRSYHRWYQLAAWRRLREAHLSDNPLCIKCLEVDRTTPATDVDHRVPHRGNWELFIKSANLDSLCKSCHSEKTARGM